MITNSTGNGGNGNSEYVRYTITSESTEERAAIAAASNVGGGLSTGKRKYSFPKQKGRFF